MKTPILGSAELTVSEWDWLQLLLRMNAVEMRSELYSCAYELEESPRRRIRCMVWAAHTSTMMREKASRAEQLDYYRGWVALEKQRIQHCLTRLPGLRKELRFKRDLVVDIAECYGMGSAVICRYEDGRFKWLL
jgi:hypothetical protein